MNSTLSFKSFDLIYNPEIAYSSICWCLVKTYFIYYSWSKVGPEGINNLEESLSKYCPNIN